MLHHGFFELEHQHDIRNFVDHSILSLCNITTNLKGKLHSPHSVESIEDDSEWNLHRPFCAKTRTAYSVICTTSKGSRRRP